MRRYAMASLVMAGRSVGAQLDEGYRFDTPGGFNPWIERRDFESMAKHDDEPMSFEHALQFARTGRSISRASWSPSSAASLGHLHVVEGSLQWTGAAEVAAVLHSEDLLANDWRVMA